MTKNQSKFKFLHLKQTIQIHEFTNVISPSFIYHISFSPQPLEEHNLLIKHEEIKQAESESPFETNWDESVENFEDLGLHEELLRGVYGYGFERPSPIQQKAILPILQGKDTIAQVS